MKKFLALLAALMMFSSNASAEKILFIPHDNRPISSQQPAEVVAQLGYEILMPPLELLTQTNELWQWLNENTPSVNAAVVGSDVLLYGGLIASRSHNIPAEEVFARVEKFKTLREKNPNLKIYVFGSLMRTPFFSTPGDIEEPDYYGQYGGEIFQYTALLDKQELTKLTANEQNYLNTLQKKIPADILDDWFARRNTNLTATKKLINFANDGTIDYFIIGRDDNAPLSQTHREARQLLAYMAEHNVPKTKAQSHAGIDEYAMLMLTRAVNDLRGEFPMVNVQFNSGVGAKTVPAYSDEEIGQSIRDEIMIAGGVYVPTTKRADFVLFVNTDVNGKTYHTHNSLPPQVLTEREQKYFQRNAKKFVTQIEEAVNKNLPVGIADVTFANGSDVALMEELHRRDLLFKLRAYGGWNTATNTSGFAVGTGILARHMSKDARDRLLARRYLDDWGYQTFVRTKIAEELSKGSNALATYLHLGEHEQSVSQSETELMRDFAKKFLPPFDFLKGLTVSNPWHRMFECEIHFGQ